MKRPEAMIASGLNFFRFFFCYRTFSKWEQTHPPIPTLESTLLLNEDRLYCGSISGAQYLEIVK
jgi:hypothetical protein